MAGETHAPHELEKIMPAQSSVVKRRSAQRVDNFEKCTRTRTQTGCTEFAAALRGPAVTRIGCICGP